VLAGLVRPGRSQLDAGTGNDPTRTQVIVALRRLVCRAHQATETEIAHALDALLTRAEHGPDKAGARVAARTRTTAGDRPTLPTIEQEALETAASSASRANPPEKSTVVPFSVFEVDAEVEKWL
jgi:putative transposase